MHRASSSESCPRKDVSEAIGNSGGEKAENEGKQEHASETCKLPYVMRKQAFLISSRNTGKLFSTLQIKHSGKGSDPNASISTGFQRQEHFRKYHQGKTNLRAILPLKEEFLHCMESWRGTFSKNSNVQPSFGSWTSHTQRQVKVTLPAERIQSARTS